MNFEIYDHPKMMIIIVDFYETLNELLLYAWSHSAEFHTINSFQGWKFTYGTAT